MDASQFEELKRAKELLDLGVLTQDEFNETKLKILRRSDASNDDDTTARASDASNDDAEDKAVPTEASKEAALAAAEDALAASLAALNVSAPAALDVGAEVWFKLPDRSIKAGVVIAVSADAYDLEEDDTGVVRKNYPMKSVKARKDKARKENHEKPPLENDEKPPLQNDEKPQIKFAVGKPSKPPPPPPAVVAAPAAVPPAPPASIPARPRLRVVVDTNVLLDAERLTPAYLLQDCGAVAIVLPTRVVQELDGLKRNDDLGEKARRCNAFLSDQATRRAPWLEFEKAPETRAGNATADEVILECALAERRSAGRDAVVLATGDRNLQLRAKMADVTALPLPDVRLMAEARDGAWRRAYGHLLPDRNDADRRRAYVRGYGNGA